MARETARRAPARPKKRAALRRGDEARNGSRNGAPARDKTKAKKRAPALPMHKTKKEQRIEAIARWMEANLPPPGTPAWEALCTGCGKCCYDKLWRGKRLLLLASACPFLDTGTNRCTVYAERFEREPMCMPIGPEIIEMGGLPEDCPYVENLPGYRGPIEVDKTLDEM